MTGGLSRKTELHGISYLRLPNEAQRIIFWRCEQGRNGSRNGQDVDFHDGDNPLGFTTEKLTLQLQAPQGCMCSLGGQVSYNLHFPSVESVDQNLKTGGHLIQNTS